jgi:UDPglucose 6-dehydrogenase
MRIIEAVLASNNLRKQSIAAKVRAAGGGDLRGKKVALFGLTFKPGTDDMRDAPAITLAQALVDGGAAVHAYDPVGNERAKALLPKSVRYHPTALGAARGADMAVVVTEWDEFHQLDLALLRRQMAAPVLVDLRNMFSEERLTRNGFRYCGIGNGGASLQGRARNPAGERVRVGRRAYRRRGDTEASGAALARIEAAE